MLTEQQSSLLEATFGTPQGTWQKWRDSVDWDDHLDSASSQLLPFLYRNLIAHGIDDRLLPRFKGVGRRNWLANQREMQSLQPLMAALADVGIPVTLLPLHSLVLLNGQLSQPKKLPIRLQLPRARAADAARAVRTVGGQLNQSPDFARGRMPLKAWIAEKHLSVEWTDEPYWEYRRSFQVMGQTLFAMDAAESLFDICQSSTNHSLYEAVVTLLIFLSVDKQPVESTRIIRLSPVNHIMHRALQEVVHIQPDLLPRSIQLALHTLPITSLTTSGSLAQRLRQHWFRHQESGAFAPSLKWVLALPNTLTAYWELSGPHQIPLRAWKGLRHEFKAARVERSLKNSDKPLVSTIRLGQLLLQKGRINYRDGNNEQAVYSMLSSNPPIFYAGYWFDEQLRETISLQPLYEHLRHQKAYFIYSWQWHIAHPIRVAQVRYVEHMRRKRYPHHEHIHLCNSPEQWAAFQRAGLSAALINHNTFVDEIVFKPLPSVSKRYDAIYDARLSVYKRHQLACEVASLALIHTGDREETHSRHVRKQLRFAAWLNHDADGTYSSLNSADVNKALNASRVGLCLSAVEGAMFASIQYLLAGIPVVSTASKGGRDLYFDEEVALIVEDNPRAVREGVQAMIARQIPASVVRERTLAKARTYREQFVVLVQQIYDDNGVERDFSAEWDTLFFDKMLRKQKHAEIFEQLSAEKRQSANPHD
ncbi:glycosyltransferase [Pseudomonadota bacterium]